MLRSIQFSSEHVTEGHPDKLCDQIADAVLDACLRDDPYALVACEVVAKSELVLVFGEITTTAAVDYGRVVRGVVKGVGYDSGDKGLDWRNCAVLVAVEHGPPPEKALDKGARDQGIVFGYATDETETLMPMSYELSRRLAQQLSAARRAGTLWWARPDGKTQVTLDYDYDTRNGRIMAKPRTVSAIVISAQHEPNVTMEQLRSDLMEHVIKPVIPSSLLTPQTKYHLNPSGSFVMGGPQADSGLTGKKIVVDTYGGWGAIGGGAFSGKDPSRIDRCGAYAARWIAKSLVASGLCNRVLVHLAYAPSIELPVNVHVDSYGTVRSGLDDASLLDLVHRSFKLGPQDIIEALRLRRPIYSHTAAFGHFGRTDREIFTWEVTRTLQL